MSKLLTELPAIVLCGGHGTRIATVAQGLPKSMLPVANTPFLALLINRMGEWGIDRFVLCTGVGGDMIARWVGLQRHKQASITLIEDEVVAGTLNPVRQAFAMWGFAEALIVNGDTMIDGKVGAMVNRPLEPDALCRVGVTLVTDTRRYGRVEAMDGRLRSLRRGVAGPGLASNGMIRARAALFDHVTPGMTGIDDVVVAVGAHGGVTIACAGDRFVDIGTPVDYNALARGG